MQAFELAQQYFNKTKNPHEANGFHLFPNPTNCVVQIEFAFEGEMPVKIFGTDGRLEQSLVARFADNQAFIDLGGLANGLHLIVGYKSGKERFFEEKVILQGN